MDCLAVKSGSLTQYLDVLNSRTTVIVELCCTEKTTTHHLLAYNILAFKCTAFNRLVSQSGMEHCIVHT